MKTEIMEVVKNGGHIKLNRFCSLNRWFEDGIGNNVDKMQLSISTLNNVEFAKSFEIKSRDYDGIITEIKSRIEESFLAIGQEIAKTITSGYSI